VNGKLFAFLHWRHLISHWRRTDKQLDWVMELGDPNQVEGELVMTAFGVTVDVWPLQTPCYVSLTLAMPSWGLLYTKRQ
jgi:hypothetical protein